MKVEGIDNCYIYNNHTYVYIKHKVNWYAANIASETAPGHLLIINNKEENDFVKKIIDYHTWMGLTDIENDGFWTWIDNTYVMWSDWAKNQPDNIGIEHYAHYHSELDYSWNNTYQMNSLYFLCEIDKKVTDLRDLKKIRTHIINSLLKYKADNYIKPYKDIDGCYLYNGHTYIYSDIKADWKKAKAACENSGGHLLIIDNESENNFIKKIIEPWTWLGLTDEETESIWKWVNGNPLTFQDWAKGQPDNQQKLEHYAHYHYHSEYYNWNDLAYNNDLKFICEYDFEITGIEELVLYKTTLIKNIYLLLEK